MILNGKKLALEIEDDIKNKVTELKRSKNITPKLVTINIGEFPQNIVYVNMKQRACERVGILCSKIDLPVLSNTSDVIKIIKELNSDNTVSGILLQHPVPAHINEQLCCNTIDINKDIDGLNSQTFGNNSLGFPSFSCATPLGIITLLKHYNIELQSKHAVVVGRSSILGKPVAMLLLNENATVTICHSKTKNIKKYLKSADIIVSCCGKPNFIKGDWVKKGVVLVDAGYNAGNLGDISNEANLKASAYSPVPGGVGPMTIAMILMQLLESAERLNIKDM